MPTRLAFLAFACCAAPHAAAQTSLASIPDGTHDWGCEVLLCLANPEGPMAVAPCVPPIERLWRELRRGHAFPSCAMASGPGGHSYARPAYSYYDRCPEGTTELQPGVIAALSSPMSVAAAPATRAGTASSYVAASTDVSYTGIGTDGGYGQANVDRLPQSKVCVAGYRGSREVGSGDNAYTVQLYDTMFVSPPRASPRVIDVFIDDAYWHSVRW